MKKVAIVLIAGLVSTLCAGSFEENVLACDNGNAKACYDAGKIHSAEAYKVEGYDQADAAAKVATLYRKSCQLEYAAGCTAYGMSYAADIEKDTEKDALYFFQKACDAGDATGCNLLKFASREK